MISIPSVTFERLRTSWNVTFAIFALAFTMKVHGGGNTSGGGGTTLFLSGKVDYPAVSNINERLGQLDKKFLEICPMDPAIKLVVLPAQLKSSFTISTKTRPVTARLLCADEKLRDAYNFFALAVHSISSQRESDGIGAYLMRKTVEKGGPIPVVITPNWGEFKNKNDTVYEYAWTDLKENKIFFSIPPFEKDESYTGVRGAKALPTPLRLEPICKYIPLSTQILLS